MEKMRIELELQKVKVKFVGVNAISANDDASKQALVDRCAFPLFQDDNKVQAWTLQSGGKDDFYIYDSQGKLVHYLPVTGAFNTDLSVQENYDALKKLILSIK